MKIIYKTVTNGFSDLDYTGKGKVKEEDFFRTLVIYKLPFTKEVSLYLDIRKLKNISFERMFSKDQKMMP